MVCVCVLVQGWGGERLAQATLVVKQARTLYFTLWEVHAGKKKGLELMFPRHLESLLRRSFSRVKVLVCFSRPLILSFIDSKEVLTKDIDSSYVLSFASKMDDKMAVRNTANINECSSGT